jgi:flagellin
MNELSVKSATGSITDEDRLNIQAEVAQLKDEIARIGETTEYNGRKLFDGTFDLKGYTDTTEIKVNYFSDTVDLGDYSFALTGLTFEADGTVKPGTTAVVTRTDVTPNVSTPVTVTGDNEQLILKGEKDYEIRLGLEDGWNATGNDISIKMELTSMGPMTLQIGANEGQTIDMRIPEVSLLNIGIKKTDVSTVDGANKAIDEIKSGIAYISQMRSRMGAYQNRLEHTQSSIAISEENITSAYSRIMDTDMAEEMTEYTNMQVVTQAATSMLAQANERPSQMLQLLQ